ncbi:YkuS family protein [Brevibacillus sp. SAFN-007a]|uniref:YkuS family protein n=1 Tax=Brevibacillus sp. SAFN-007a TaxID=3436862 RepID=UPI003F7E4F6C
MARVAVEKSLSQIRKMLGDNGYEVVDLGNWQQVVDAIVITGQDQSVLGDPNMTVTGASIINAEGMTADEVFHAVHERLSPIDHH